MALRQLDRQVKHDLRCAVQSFGKVQQFVLGVAGIKFTGQHYRARLDGRLFVISETEPLHGRASDEELLEVATVLDVLPPL